MSFPICNVIINLKILHFNILFLFRLIQEARIYLDIYFISPCCKLVHRGERNSFLPSGNERNDFHHVSSSLSTLIIIRVDGKTNPLPLQSAYQILPQTFISFMRVRGKSLYGTCCNMKQHQLKSLIHCNFQGIWQAGLSVSSVQIRGSQEMSRVRHLHVSRAGSWTRDRGETTLF